MALNAKGNKNSATEDELGELHAMIALIFKRKLQHWIKLLDLGGDADLIIDMKQLNNVIKFVGDNGIICQDPAASSNSELHDNIVSIKKAQEARLTDKGVGFTDDDQEYEEVY